MSKVRAAASDKGQEYKLTAKQWIVYYYLISISRHKITETHYYIYKNEINISKFSRILKVSRPTFYSAIKKMTDVGIMMEFTDYYHIEIPEVYAEINRNMITYLLLYQRFMGADLLRVYIVLLRWWQVSAKKRITFTKKQLVELLSHSKTETDRYFTLELILGMLDHWKIAKIKKQIKISELGPYTEFLLESVSDFVPENINIEAEMNAPDTCEETFEKIKTELAADPYWALQAE